MLPEGMAFKHLPHNCLHSVFIEAKCGEFQGYSGGWSSKVEETGMSKGWHYLRKRHCLWT